MARMEEGNLNLTGIPAYIYAYICIGIPEYVTGSGSNLFKDIC